MSGACKYLDFPVSFVVKTAYLYGNNEFSRGLVTAFQQSYTQ